MEDNLNSAVKRRLPQLYFSNERWPKLFWTEDDLILLLPEVVFQAGATVPSSGWQLFYKENKAQAQRDGVTGKSLASVLGQSWRSLAPEVKNMYKRKSYVLVNLNASSCECDLVKSKSCSVQYSEAEVKNKLKRHKSDT